MNGAAAAGATPPPRLHGPGQKDVGLLEDFRSFTQPCHRCNYPMLASDHGRCPRCTTPDWRVAP